jgi:hypothetical protein
MRNERRARSRRLRAAIVGSAAVSLIWAVSAHAAVVYNNFPSPLPGNVVSEAFQATQTGQFGGQIEIAGSPGAKTKVTVGLSSWGCQKGNWYEKTCETTKGAKFEWPVTLHMYTVGAGNEVGTQFAQVTRTFKIPYRPSASPKCTGERAGAWYHMGECFNGKLARIKFSLKGVSLPSRVIMSVSYNTSGYGTSPQGYEMPCNSTSAGCPYDSLNVGLTEPMNPESPAPVAPSVGGNPAPEAAYQDSTTASNYCDAGLKGTGTFRLDSGVPPCWTGYQPLFLVETE